MSADEAKKLADQQKVKDAIATLNKEIPVELARWNDEMKINTRALVATKFKTPKDAISAVLASPHRMPGNAERDASRHPLETLSFFGLTPTSRVVEMGIGQGWYTEILAPVVASEGQFTGGGYDAAGPDDQMRTVYGLRQKALFAKSDDLFGKAKTFDLGAESVELGEPGSADLVLAIREMHNWQRRDTIDANLKAVVSVLAPGGTFGVVQHRAPADAKAEESAEQGYLPEAWLIAKIEATGLKLVEKSEINANPKDTKDYADGVWTLPPNFRAGETDERNTRRSARAIA